MPYNIGRHLRRHTLHRHFRKYLHHHRSLQGRTSHRLWFSVSSIIISLFLVFTGIAGMSSFLIYRLYTNTTEQFHHQIVSLHDFLPHDNLKMYDRNGLLLRELTDQGTHTRVPLKQVAQPLINATISTEDKQFWTNPGVDVARMLEAALEDATHGRVVQGGSTITQQLIKILVVGNEPSMFRKLQEVLLTPAINQRYSKTDILEMYLNSIYYGNQAYGIDAAASRYFGLTDQPDKPASAQLDLAQAAMLAGMPSSPTLYNPFVNPKTMFKRFLTVLNLMTRDGYISHQDALNAIQEAHKTNFFKATPEQIDRAPHFTQYTLKELEQQFHLTRSQLSRSGMKVYTTLDLNMQNQIQTIAQQHVAALQYNHVSNAAEVLIDYHTGAIRTLLGSIDYNNTTIDGKFDVATQGFRQPGSSFKPYVYATAFEQGTSPAQSIDDAPLKIVLPAGSNPPVYAPQNYDHTYHGHVTIRCALQNSLNIPAVKTLQHVGIENAMKTAHAMGIIHTEGTPTISLVLGGLDVNLLEHTSAFGTFANNGVHVPPYSVEKVIFTSNNKVYHHQSVPGQRALSPQIAYMITNVLSDNQSRIPEFFDCNVLQLYPNSASDCNLGNRGSVRPAAAKTGTTNDFRDNWTLGYTSDYVMGVWVGNDDNSPMINVSGIDGAAPIWHDGMLVAEKGLPIRDFTDPGGLQRLPITYADGLQTTDLFLPGTYQTSWVQNNNTIPIPSSQVLMPPLQSRHSNLTFSGHPYCSNYTFVPPSAASASIW